jgi:hypothetical protein
MILAPDGGVECGENTAEVEDRGLRVEEFRREVLLGGGKCLVKN